MSVGLELARAREEKDLSRKELAIRTGLSPQSIAAIEEDNVNRLPDMLSLRSCVGALAAEVGLDPDITSERYMAQLNRSALDEFASEESLRLEATSTTGVDAVDPADAFPREMPAPARRQRGERVSRLALWVAWMRPASLTYGSLAVVTLITLTAGVRLLVPPRRPAHDMALNAPPLPVTADVTPPVETITPSPPRDSGELTGTWMLTSQVERSSNDIYNDLTLGFRLQLDQTGHRVRGQGLKWTENGRHLASRARTPITIDGTIKDGRLILAFTERGTRRTSYGTLNLQRADDGSLRGRFSTDAAQSSGRAHAVRLLS
jgi:transcriptional regulator with XRE-family HTH domain